MGRQWLTPDSVPGLSAKTIMLPNSADFHALFWGALLLLSYEYNWDKWGSAAPEDCAAAFRETLFEGFVTPTGGGDSVEIGSIVNWPGSVIPTGYLVCDGSPLSAAAYPDLFAVIGYGFGGSGDDFNLPDLRGNFVLGVSGSYPLGASGGEEEHTLTGGEMPVHSHLVTRGPSHPTLGSPAFYPSLLTQYPTTAGATTEANGADMPHNNMPPYLTLIPIIKAE